MVQASVARLLKPLVRLLLRYGIPYGIFADIAKRIYVETAMEEFGIPGRKSSISRASVITGLSRKEVVRVQKLPPLSDQNIQDRYNRAVRVISGWMGDTSFTGADGEPKTLALEGARGSFSQLVQKYGGDVPVRAVLDELLRVGVVERMDSGEVRLSAPAYVPEGGEEDKLGILGTDVADLIATIDHNLVHSGKESRLQLKVAYDNLPADALAGFRDLSSKKAIDLLREFDRELSQLDRDTNPDSGVNDPGRVRAGVSICYFEENLPEEKRQED